MQSVFHSYSGRIPSLTSINHKRGKSGQIGQHEEVLKVTLEETEDLNQQINENEETPQHKFASSHGPAHQDQSIITAQIEAAQDQ